MANYGRTVVDYYRRIVWKEPWVGSKFFVFNVTTITLLTVVTKHPSDMTGVTPCLVDQLTKLSGISLLCVAMERALPSFGNMDDLAAFSHLTALGITVVSTFVYIWIQLNSGAIFDYYLRGIYIYYSFNMLLLFMLLLSYVPHALPSRMILQKKYYKLHEQILKKIFEENDPRDRYSYDYLRDYVTKYWLMAVTSSQVYRLNNSGVAIAAPCLNLYPNAIVFFYGIYLLISSKLKNGDELTCFVRSDYSWYTWLILAFHVLTIGVGSQKSIRLVVRSMSREEWNQEIKDGLLMSSMFKKNLNDTHLPTWISNMLIRRATYFSRRILISIWIAMMFFVIIMSTVIVFLNSYFIDVMIICKNQIICIVHKVSVGGVCSSSTVHNSTTSEDTEDMSEYVLSLDTDRDVVQSKKTARHLQKYPTMWIDNGGENKPTKLSNLLCVASLAEALEAVNEFYSEQFPPENPAGPLAEPLNCWALQIVTLARILHAARTDWESWKLVVDESLRYVGLVDKIPDEQGTTIMQTAAKTFWKNFCRHLQLVNDNFDNTGQMNLSDIIENLHKDAKEEIKKDPQCESWKYWSEEAFIPNCMYTTTNIILKILETGESTSNPDWLEERLEKVLKGLLCACLTNLPRAIFEHCSSGTFGLRTDRVKEAATILGETKELVELLGKRAIQDKYPKKRKEYFESWYKHPPPPQSSV